MFNVSLKAQRQIWLADLLTPQVDPDDSEYLEREECRVLSANLLMHLFQNQDILIFVIGFLQVKDIVRLSMTCKAIRKVLSIPEVERQLLREKAKIIEKAHLKKPEEMLFQNVIGRMGRNLFPQPNYQKKIGKPLKNKRKESAKKVESKTVVESPKTERPPMSREAIIQMSSDFEQYLSRLSRDNRIRREAMITEQRNNRFANIMTEQYLEPELNAKKYCPVYWIKQGTQKIKRYLNYHIM